jgi:hypothetical protein
MTLSQFGNEVEENEDVAGVEEAKNDGNTRFNGASFLSGDDSFNNVVRSMNKAGVNPNSQGSQYTDGSL